MSKSGPVGSVLPKARVWGLVCAAIFAGVCLSFQIIWVRPELVYQAQQPAFLWERHFATEFLTYPGGPNELLGRVFGQLMYQRLVGALAVTGLLCTTALIARRVWTMLGAGRRLCLPYWVPAIILLALHSDYGYPWALSIGLLWVMVGWILYVRCCLTGQLVRFLVFVLLQAGLYYVLAGQALVFAAGVIAYELMRGRAVLALAFAVLAAVLPYALALNFFMVHMPDAYMNGLAGLAGYRTGWVWWAVSVWLVATMGFGRLVPISLGSHRFTGPAQAILLALLVPGSAMLSYDPAAKRILLVDYHAADLDWRRVLAAGADRRVNPPYIQYEVNRALYHTGSLLDRMFAFAQYPGARSLFLKGQMCMALPLRHSDLFMDLGLVNEAEHWAYEAVELRGYTGRNLRRLVEVYLLKEDPQMADKYLWMLSRSPWQRAIARRYAEYLADPNGISGDPYLARVRRAMPDRDFLISPEYPEFCLVELVKDPANRMAFEYYMAQCLLEGDLKGIMRYISRLEELDYPRIPRHLEEAILIAMQAPGLGGLPLHRLEVSDEVKRDFEQFNRVLARYRYNRRAAYRELSRYGDTYWFYWQYVILSGGGRSDG